MEFRCLRTPVYVILRFGARERRLAYIYQVSKNWSSPFMAMCLLHVSTCALSHLMLKYSIIFDSGGRF